MNRPRLLNVGCGKRRHPAWTNADLVPSSPDIEKIDLREPLPWPESSFDAVYAAHVLEHLGPDAGRRVLAEIRRVLKPGGVARLVVPDLEGICRAYVRELDAAARGDAEALTRHAWITLELVDQLARTRTGGLMLRWWQRDPVPAEPFVVERMGADGRDTIEHFRRRRAASGKASLTAADWDELPEQDDAAILAFRRSGEAHRWMYDRVSLARALEGAGLRDPKVVTAQDSRIPGWAEYHLDADDAGRAHKPDSLYLEGVKQRGLEGRE